MAVSRSHTWIAGEVLLASDLNSEFNNILTNGTAVAFPATSAISMGGFALNFDAANTIALTGTTNGISLSGGAFNTAQGASIASASTINLDTATGNYPQITGVVTITAITLSQGRWRWVEFSGALTLTNGASLILPGGANITTAAGDTALFFGEASSVVRCVSFISAKGLTPGIPVPSTSGKTLVDNGSAFVETDYVRLPININPNWLFDQINEGALYTVNTTGVQGPDGWTGNAIGTGVFKLRTLADPDSAALKCLEISCTTADASIASTDKYEIFTAIEGYDAADLKIGTSAASQMTIQFKLKSNSVTGVMGVAVQNSATNRRYIGTITVPDTNENSYSVTLTLDTSGTWLYTTGVGMYVFLTLAAGSNFQATAGAWGAGAEKTTSAQANFMSVNTNIVYLKRFHVVPGGIALAYASQDAQKELAKVQRHYCKTFAQGVAPVQNVGSISGCLRSIVVAATSGGTMTWRYPIEMRGAPTIVTYNPSNTNANWRNNVPGDSTVTVGTPNTSGVTLNDGTAAGNFVDIHASANARIS